MARLQGRYRTEIVPRLMRDLGEKNPMALPRLDKITVSMGIGRANEEKKRLEDGLRDLAAITGQKPVVTRARVSIAGFRLREGMPVGCLVTLRGRRMYEFLDRLINLAIPRIRDFRGLSPGAFDGNGNYNMGLAEQAVFPEIDSGKMEFTQGMNIAITIRNGDKERSSVLLREFGMPFRKD
ncbi:MAG: 50S ribosomal protein L5 [Planctomycetes bacterium]|nr:50S ribosomal protein L5 [Planctomycetota bacterium]